MNKNVLAGAHKKSERVQHTEIYLLGLKLQYKHKTKLPLDMVSKHVLLSVQHPDYRWLMVYRDRVVIINLKRLAEYFFVVGKI